MKLLIYTVIGFDAIKDQLNIEDKKD